MLTGVTIGKGIPGFFVHYFGICWEDCGKEARHFAIGRQFCELSERMIHFSLSLSLIARRHVSDLREVPDWEEGLQSDGSIPSQSKNFVRVLA